jgi:HEAT repeat protein
MKRQEFNECIQMIRSDDPMTFENGYVWIQNYLNIFIDDLIKLTTQEENPRIRARFVELLGDSSNSKVIPYLRQELKHSERHVRSWAYTALEYFGEPEASKIAEEFKLANPHEDFL